MKRIAAVTGSTGFIGWHLCAHLERSGWEVRGVVREQTDKQLPSNVTRCPSRLERTSLAKAFAGAEVVFHLAGVTRAKDLASYLPVNVEAAREVGLAALDAGARCLHVSSQAAAGLGSVQRPKSESDPAEPISDYGRSKLLGESAVKAIEGLQWTVVRPSAVYGPRDRDFQDLFQLAAKGLFPLTGSPETAYSMIFVGDLVAALEAVALSEHADRDTFFVSHPIAITVEELMRSLAVLADRTYRPFRIPQVLLKLGMYLSRTAYYFGRAPLLTESRYHELTAGDFVCSCEKLKTVIGVSAPTSLEDGLRLTYRSYA